MTIECPHRPDCDGCPRFEQTEAQRATALLDHVTRLAEQFDLRAPSGLLASDQDLGYRNRARMIVRHEHERPLGFYRAGSRDYIGIERCLVHDPRIEEVLTTVRDLASHTVVKASRFVDVRAGENVIMTFAVTRELDPDTVADFAQRLQVRHPGIAVHLNIHPKHGVLSGRQEVVCGDSVVRFDLNGRLFEAPPTAFFQLNTRMLEAIHERIRPWISDEAIVDAYCGVGVHGLSLGSGPVYGMDSVPDAVEAAKRNAIAVGRVAEFALVQDHDTEGWAPPFEGATVILNPARSGVDKKFLTRLGSQPARQLVYVSCNPLTFYRDAERLAQQGWRLDALHAFELLPRTDHIELVGRFSPGSAREKTPDAAESASTWVAIVDGVVPHGALPNGSGGVIMARRIRTLDGASVIRLTCAEPIDSLTICQRLRAWKHPVIGDHKFGSRKVNARWQRERFIDEPLLACTQEDKLLFRVPGLIVATAQLPANAFDRE